MYLYDNQLLVMILAIIDYYYLHLILCVQDSARESQNAESLVQLE